MSRNVPLKAARRLIWLTSFVNAGSRRPVAVSSSSTLTHAAFLARNNSLLLCGSQDGPIPQFSTPEHCTRQLANLACNKSLLHEKSARFHRFFTTVCLNCSAEYVAGHCGCVVCIEVVNIGQSHRIQNMLLPSRPEQ
jgi:hypothetical protein